MLTNTKYSFLKRSIKNSTIIKAVFIALSFLFASANMYAQGNNPENLLRKANRYFDKKDFNAAIPLYLEIEKSIYLPFIEQEELLYRIAYSYYSTEFDKDKSIPYFLKYFSVADTVYEPHYFLGQVYQLSNCNDEALEQYLILKRLVEADKSSSKETIEGVLKLLNRQIACCNYGKFLIEHPIKAISQNLGDTINTTHSEYAPVINSLEEKLVFTRRSPETTGGKISPDGNYFEDIYACEILEGRLMHKFDYDSSLTTGYQNMISNYKFSSPYNMGPNINSNAHEGGVTFSYDSKKLFIYKNQQIWVSEFENGIWQPAHEIEGLAGVVNKNSFEPSISLSLDENEIYIACDQPGGYGGLDLYKSVKVNGVWSPAANLGPRINTAEDEDSPYIDPNGKRLYFSSRGHSSMGGFDIFRSEFDGKEWSAPSNLGFPVNSAGDDIFFIMPLKYNRGYYSSNKTGGKGKMDLYRVTFADERPSFAEIRGLVLKGDKFVPTYSSISLLDPLTKESLTSHESDSTSGHYLLMVSHGTKNLMKVETPGFSPVIREFTIPPRVDFFQFYQEIHHIYIRDKFGNVIGQMISLFTTENSGRLLDSLRESDGKLGEKFMRFLLSYNVKDSTYKNLMLDVKFYYSEDSIAKLSRTDSLIPRKFPPGTDISFAGKGKYTSGKDGALPVEYTKAKSFTVNKENNFIVLTSDLSSDSLAQILKKDPEVKVVEGVSSEKITRVVVLFEYDKAVLSKEFYDKIDVVVDFMKKNTNFYFEISGHTDSKGNDDYNYKLSVARAEAVKRFMQSRGISSERLTIVGKGEKSPISYNENPDGSDNPQGRKENRRIEFKVLKQ
jgi:outer membrane protein OmpA-like peptidoglycan-associated protein/tetratricopeptide (TPR) repeat protein